MAEYKMTDNEIIKALDICSKNGFCSECPYSDDFTNCNTRVCKDVLALIYRQRAKIEALQMDNEQLQSDIINVNMNLEHQQEDIKDMKIENQSLRSAANSYKIHYNKAKAEAIREFAERLKERNEDFCVDKSDMAFVVDSIVKEMVGDTEAMVQKYLDKEGE